MSVWDWAYLGGWAWTMRYALGIVRVQVHEDAWGDEWDMDDIMLFCLGAFIAGLACLVWPALIAGRLVYRGVMMVNVSGHSSAWEKILPAPKKVESRAEKQARKERERRDENRELKRRIAELEAETGVGR